MIDTVGAATAASTSQAAKGGKATSADQFMQLLLAQLTHQDPLKPMDTTEMMQQVVGLESVQRLTSVQKAVEGVQRAQNLTASALIGKRVEVSAQGETAIGTVEKVRMRDGKVTLVVGGSEYPLESLVSVEEPS